MPTKAPTACRRPGCAGLVRGGVCSKCGPVTERSNWDAYYRERNTVSRHKRGYGWTWEKLRAMVLADEPLCRQCHAAGVVAAAVTVDHIIPKAWGGTDETENLQALCASCHRDKTARERRGRLQRAVIPTTVVAGPPGSGKSTYVAERMQPGDLLLDVDALFVALSGLAMYDARRTALLPFVMDARHAVLARLSRTSAARRAWVVTTESDARQLQRLVDDLGAALVVLAVPARDCIERIAADSRRGDTATNWPDVVERWWRDWRATGGETLAGGVGGV